MDWKITDKLTALELQVIEEDATAADLDAAMKEVFSQIGLAMLMPRARTQVYRKLRAGFERRQTVARKANPAPASLSQAAE